MHRIFFIVTCLLFFFVSLSATALITIFAEFTLFFWIISKNFLKPFWKEKWFIPLLWLILIHWIGLLYTPDITLGLKLVRKTHYWVLSFAIMSLSFYYFNPENFVKAYLAGLTAGSLYFVLVPNTINKLKSPFHITFSLQLVLGMLLLSFYFLKVKKWYYKIGFFILFLIFGYVLTISEGRTGYVAFILTLPIIFYNLFPKNYLKVIFVCFLSVILFLNLNPVKRRIHQAIYDLKKFQKDHYYSPVGLRLYMWKTTIKIFKEHPLLGGGTGCFPKYAEKFKPKKILPNFSQPHNSYLYLLGSFGILGLIPFLWLLYLMFKTGIKHYHNPIGFFIFAFTLVFSIGSLGDSQIISHATCILFGLTVGLQSFLKE